MKTYGLTHSRCSINIASLPLHCPFRSFPGPIRPADAAKPIPAKPSQFHITLCQSSCPETFIEASTKCHLLRQAFLTPFCHKGFLLSPYSPSHSIRHSSHSPCIFATRMTRAHAPSPLPGNKLLESLGHIRFIFLDPQYLAQCWTTKCVQKVFVAWPIEALKRRAEGNSGREVKSKSKGTEMGVATARTGARHQPGWARWFGSGQVNSWQLGSFKAFVPIPLPQLSTSPPSLLWRLTW